MKWIIPRFLLFQNVYGLLEHRKDAITYDKNREKIYNYDALYSWNFEFVAIRFVSILNILHLSRLNSGAKLQNTKLHKISAKISTFIYLNSIHSH